VAIQQETQISQLLRFFLEGRQIRRSLLRWVFGLPDFSNSPLVPGLEEPRLGGTGN
jgi:hypothetical protein